jgi:cytidine deaminase
LVGAVGCDLESVSRLLSEALAAASYHAHTVRVSSLLHQLDKYQLLSREGSGSEYERIKAHMKAGTDLRSTSKRGDIMAWLAVGAIRAIRSENSVSPHSDSQLPTPLPRSAFIIRSLKHPAEIQTLRDVYGRAFFVISAYAPREK